MRVPRRGSFHYRIYVDIVCDLKQYHKRTDIIPRVAEARGVPPNFVKRIYREYVAPQLRAGLPVRDLI
jgi:hypothetical protein